MRVLTSILLCAAVAAPLAASLEDDLAFRWQGAWVLTRVESYSGCGAFYTNNQVRGGQVASKGDRRFARGEVAKLDKVDLKRKRVDLLLSLEEPLLVPHQDGPFTLYDEVGCKVELQVELPEGARDRGLQALDREVAAVLERFPGPDEARRAPGWNRRVRDPYPPDYRETLAAHAAWQVEQWNRAVQARLDEGIDEAARLVHDIDDDPDYLAGFGAGAERAKNAFWGECESLVNSSVHAFTQGPPRDRGGRGEHGDAADRWRRGYEDGQKLVYYLELARRARGCFQPPPAVG